MTDEITKDRAERPSESSGNRGRLKIFLGIGPGVGKTAAMLKAAITEKIAGRRVLVSVAHGHGMRAVETLLRKLRWSAAEAPQRPDIVIMDELAHPRRFQEALELMEAGVDVYTTLNIYEIASHADLLWEITGAASDRVVSDQIIENAALQLVDIPPAELIARWQRGAIHLPEVSERDKLRFFEQGNLMDLREMTVRFFAAQAAKEAQNLRQTRRAPGPARGGHQVLAAIESGSDAEHLILWTRRLAGSLNASWILLYVETPSEARFKEESRLTRILELAQELGAEVVTTVSGNFVDAVSRMALSRNVTQIVVGRRAPAPWWRPFSRGSSLAQLMESCGTISVHVAPIRARKYAAVRRELQANAAWVQYAITTVTIGAMTLAGFMFTPLVGAHATALLFLLATVTLALYVDRGPALLAATLSALSWDYFFLPPVFAFQITHEEDALLLVMFFVVALVLGQLTVRIRTQEAVERQREGRATALYLLTRELAEATTVDQIVERVVEQIGRYVNAEAAVLLPDAEGRLAGHPANTLTPDEKEQEAAEWAYERRQPAGKFTGNLPEAGALFTPLESGSGVVGALGLRLAQAAPPALHQKNLLDALSRQIALALDRQRLSALSEKAKVLAESERLGKTLLDSMSHEIRTPLAAIKTAVGSLSDLAGATPPIGGLVAELQEASDRLNRLVGKALDITRLDSGYIKPLFNECEVNDIVHVAVAETEKELARHKLAVEIAPGLPIIRADFVFLQQALMNLLSNAAIHTPAGTPVTLRVWSNGNILYLSVADRGPGLEAAGLSRVFDKFYRGPNAPTGGTGLGLSLVKGFVEALGGSVSAANRAGGGAEFIIALPAPGGSAREPVAI